MARSGLRNALTPSATTQRIDVERVGLVENRQARFEHCHLEDLVALLLAARETGVDRPVQEILIEGG
jgi:hypothetical protein